MTTLTSNEQAFVNLMARDKDRATWGFDLLLKQLPKTLVKYFDLLREKGLFAADNDQRAIPSWPALEYLEAVAKIASEKNYMGLAEKIMTIVRTGSKNGKSDIRSSDNHYACHMFAKIIGSVPLSAINIDDIELIALWLDNEFDCGATAKEVSEGILRRVLDENTENSLKMACRILYHCTAIKWDGKPEPDYGRTEITTVVDDYYLVELLDKHLPAFGEKAVEETAEIFIQRLKQIFVTEKIHNRSDLRRPAIEDHSQNHAWAKPVNRFVEGLRDVLSRWVVHDSQAAQIYINKLKNDKTGIIRRIVIHTLNHHWTVLSDIYLSMVSVELFQDENLHELYELLSTRFTDMTQKQRNATLDAIRNLPASDYGTDQDRDRWLKSDQRKWLSAVVGKGDDTVDKWYAELNADMSIGELSSHPNFPSYIESWWGPGPSPYTAQDLLAEAKNGTLVDLLNNFEETDGWRGPTIHALTDTLVEAIKEDPQLFTSIIEKFVIADRPYQYGIINGFKQLWDIRKDSQRKVIDWSEVWEKLIDFFDKILSDKDFWKGVVDTDPHFAPNRDWIPPVIAQFLHAGTCEDNHSYPVALLPRAWKLITLLLEKIKPESEIREDAMFQAINSAKGKVIEALFNHALRACRVSDKETGEHYSVWTEIRPVFDRELDKCKGANFEFSTLAGAYLTNLAYMNHEWLRENIQRIFPEEYTDNCVCALNGIAHATASRPVYSMLTEMGVLDRALQIDIKKQHIKEILLQWIATAYLWGDETLEGKSTLR